jgi:hypothetical protein
MKRDFDLYLATWYLLEGDENIRERGIFTKDFAKTELFHESGLNDAPVSIHDLGPLSNDSGLVSTVYG